MTERYHHGDLPNALRQAAVGLIIERGLGAFSLREVARRAGVSHNAPAHHFGDTTGLLTSLATEGFERLRELTSAALVDADDDPAERLVAVGLAYVTTGVEYPAHCQVMFRSDLVDSDDAELQAAGVSAYRVVRDASERLVESERLTADVDEVARLCWSAMQGLVVLYPTMVELDTMMGRHAVTREHLVGRFIRTIVCGLRHESPTEGRSTRGRSTTGRSRR